MYLPEMATIFVLIDKYIWPIFPNCKMYLSTLLQILVKIFLKIWIQLKFSLCSQLWGRLSSIVVKNDWPLQENKETQGVTEHEGLFQERNLPQATRSRWRIVNAFKTTVDIHSYNFSVGQLVKGWPGQSFWKSYFPVKDIFPPISPDHFCPLKAFPAALPVSEQGGAWVRGGGGGCRVEGCLDGGGEAGGQLSLFPSWACNNSHSQTMRNSW